MTTAAARPHLLAGSTAIDEVVARADAALRRQRRREGITFPNVEAALGWYLERRDAMQHPQSIHPRGERAPDGQMVIVDIDGGKGGDIDGVHLTLAAISRALHDLKFSEPRGYKLLELSIIGDVNAPDPDPEVVRWVKADMDAAIRGRRDRKLEVDESKIEAKSIADAASWFELPVGTVRRWMNPKRMGMSHREIAESTGLGQGTVSGDIGRAVAYLTAFMRATEILR